MKTTEKREERRRHLANFHIAGFGYWDGCEALEMLKPGKELKLVWEDDNKFDPYAVAVWYGDYKLGFVPRGANREIRKYLEMGWDNLFEVRVTRVTPDVHPEQQVEVIVYIRRNQ